MRGDSLRDFYAKTLAVLGLGLIAGAGAIVDYWPTGIRLPATTSPSIAHLTVPPLTQDLNRHVPSPSLVAAREAQQLVDARHVRWPAFAPRPKATAGLVRPAAFTPVSAEAATPAAETGVASSGVPVSYTTPVSEWAPEMFVASRIAPEQLDTWLGGPSEPTGFIGGALKKTKDSLVKTGAVTSASLGNAVRGVVGAFKKVSPF
ncbi:MAG TPA: hypothetical protein VMS54_02505 [Vicinamibacterales bacterium]|nr:hypothetical protein [Vicinamibacterales bacterium]